MKCGRETLAGRRVGNWGRPEGESCCMETCLAYSGNRTMSVAKLNSES